MTLTAKEANEMYRTCSERDQLFLKAVLEMLTAIYCTEKERGRTVYYSDKEKEQDCLLSLRKEQGK